MENDWKGLGQGEGWEMVAAASLGSGWPAADGAEEVEISALVWKMLEEAEHNRNQTLAPDGGCSGNEYMERGPVH